MSFGQCKSIVTGGINKLDEFTFNGKVNLLTLNPDKHSTLKLTFYKGFYYKIQLNYEFVFNGNISFKVFDEKHHELFNSSEKGDFKIDSFVFYSNTSQNLTVEVNTKGTLALHCLAVLVGIQPPKSEQDIMALSK